jgi:hypothetical protein
VRKAISIVVAALLAVSVVSTIIVWTAGSPKKPLQVVRGVIGSEDKEFFGDPRVRAAFATRGLDVKLTTVVKAQIATTVHRSKSDFAFGAGIPDVRDPFRALREDEFRAVLYADGRPFTDIAQLLEQAGTHDHGGWWTLKKGFLDLVAPRALEPAGGKHRLLGDERRAHHVDRRHDGSSAEAYASIASYVANRDACSAVLQVDRW